MPQVRELKDLGVRLTRIQHQLRTLASSARRLQQTEAAGSIAGASGSIACAISDVTRALGPAVLKEELELPLAALVEPGS